jgi:segregation and condensation protein B
LGRFISALGSRDVTVFYEHLKGSVEALLFARGDPLPANQIAQLLTIPVESVVNLLDGLSRDMEKSERGLIIVEVAGGYQLCTKPELAATVEKLAHVQEARLSPAAMETVAIIAFRQPVTRQEVEAIRGVGADKMLNNLIERGLIRELGRKDAIGRPILYGTSEQFLQCFGLKDLKDLPPLAGFLQQENPEEGKGSS